MRVTDFSALSHMTETPKRRILTAALSAAMILLFALIHQVYLTQAHPDALYMDSLRLLYQLQEWEQGRITLLEFSGQGSAHRGLINQLLLWVNVSWFSLDVFLINRLTGLAMLGVASVLSVVAFGYWSHRRSGNDGWLAASLFVLIPMLIFSWSGFELFTLDLGFPLWLKNLSIVAYFASHSRLLARVMKGLPVPCWWSWLLLCFGFAMIFVVTMGWSYAFVCTVMGMNLLALLVSGKRVRFRLFGELLMSMGLLVGLFAYFGKGGSVGDSPSTLAVFSQLPQVIGLLPYSLGSSWMGVESAAHWEIPLSWLYGLGLSSVVMAAFGVCGRVKRGLSSAPMLPIYLLAYGGLSAFSVCIARGESGPAAVMASRYYMDVVLFQIGALWLFAEYAAERLKQHSVSASAVYALAWFIVLSTQVLVVRDEWLSAPYRKVAFQAMNEAVFAGVPDDAAARLLQSPLEYARLGAGVMRERSLGVFADAPHTQDCDISLIVFNSGWYDREQTGRWMSDAGTVSVPACSCELSFEFYVPEGFETRTLTIDDPARQFRFVATSSAGESMLISLPGASHARNVTFGLDRITLPARDLPGGVDRRELGAHFSTPSFSCVDMPNASELR